MVASGDEGTGKSEVIPSTTTPKGPNTEEAVIGNKDQIPLPFESLNLTAPAEGKRITWILLHHRTPKEIRCELSLPVLFSPVLRTNRIKIDHWQERILLKTIPLDDESIDIDAPSTQDIVVEVKRQRQI